MRQGTSWPSSSASPSVSDIIVTGMWEVDCSVCLRWHLTSTCWTIDGRKGRCGAANTLRLNVHKAHGAVAIRYKFWGRLNLGRMRVRAGVGMMVAMANFCGEAHLEEDDDEAHGKVGSYAYILRHARRRKKEAAKEERRRQR